MNNPALEQLRDIHLPQAVHWWPPAPGWWIVAALVLALTIWLSRYLLARYRRQYFRGESQDLLKQIWQDYENQTGNRADADRDFIENTLALLRRAGKTAQLSAASNSEDGSKNHSENSAAALNEEHLQSIPSPALLKALDEHSAGKLSAALPLQDINERLYRAESKPLSPEQAKCFHSVAKNWLRSL